jgi:hypothetical protein
MPGNVDDFINRFGGEQNSNDEQDATQLHERFVSSAPEDREFDTENYHQGATEYLGQLPDDQFSQVARKSYAQLPSNDQQSLANTLMSALASSGVDVRALGQQLGLSGSTPQQMTPDDYARLANYTRHEQPDAMKQVIEKKPWWLKALGHPILMGALGMVASKMLHGRLTNK